MNHFLQKKRSNLCTVWLLLLLITSHVIYAQSNLKHYNNILNSNKKDSIKISTIESWILSISKKTDSYELQEIYSDFSKFCYKEKEFNKAIFNANQALKIQLTLIDTLPQLVNKTYNNLSVFYQKAGNASGAYMALKNLTALHHKDKYTVIAYVNGLKDRAIQRGDYYKALEYIQEAERIVLGHQKESVRQEYYRIPIAYSGVYLKLGGKMHYTKGIEVLKKADSLNLFLNNEQRQARNNIIIHNRFGQIYSNLKDYDKAIYHFQKALDTTTYNLKKSNYQQATLLNNLGVNYFKKGLTEKAFKAYNQALYFDPKYTATYDNLGDYFLTKNEHNKALLHYQKAIDYNLNIHENHDFNTLPKKEWLEIAITKTELLNDLKDKAKAWLSLYKKTQQHSNLKNALSTVELADYLVDLIRQESVETKSRFFWRAKEIDLYMLATSIAYELNAPEKAIYFMEKSKSLALLENLTHEEAKKRANLPDSLIDKEYELKKNIFTTRQRLEKDYTISEARKKHNIYLAKKQYQDFINSLENKYPNYYQYKKEIQITSYKDITKNAKETKATFLQYILSDKKGYGILVTPEQTNFFEIKDPISLQKEIITLGKLLKGYWKIEEDQKLFNSISQSIYNKLIPIDLNKTLKISEDLVIIPDYTLQFIPFEVLLKPHHENETPKYLIQDFNISYLYSISLNQQVKQRKNKAPKFFLGLAPVYFKHMDLPDLSLSSSKIEAFKKEYNADVFLNNEASKANFIDNCNNYQILHLSSHANSLSNETPWIAFSDEKLTLNELYFIPNNADLVILDACKTSIGQLLPGEGSLSLTRGFFHSGAKSVISSLWNTNEKSSNEIISNFYAYLKKGVPRSQALRSAKLDFISTHHGSEKSPYYWGALVLTGESDYLPIPQKEFRYWIIIPLGILALLGLFFIIKKEKNITLLSNEIVR